MKRNKNFFLMWMALVGLFTVTLQTMANGSDTIRVPKEIGVYWVKDGVAHPLTVSPSNFIASVTDYTAQIPFRADTFYVGVKWLPEPALLNLNTKDSIPVTVKKGDEIIPAIYKEDGGDGGFKDGKYDGHYDKVYVIRFKDASDQIDGSLSFTVAGTAYQYKLTVTRVAKSSISSLIKLAVVASTDTAKWEEEFKKAALFAKEEGERKDSVFFKYLNDSIKTVEPGDNYVEKDSVNADQKLALVLRQKDMFSKVKVGQLGNEIAAKEYKFAGDCSVYSIEPGTFVTITVTAEDGTTKSEYKVKIFARPAESFEDEQKNKVIGSTPKLDSLYLLDSKDGFYKLDKEFNRNTFEYKVTIPREFAPDAVVGYVWDTVKGSNSNADTIFIGNLKYEFHEGDPAYYEVNVLSLDGRTTVKTYKITVRYPEVSLKSFVLKDSVGTTNLDHSEFHFHFDSDTLIYPLTLKYNAQDSISVWLTVNDTHAKVELIGLSEATPSGSKLSTSAQEKEGLYKFRIPVGKADEGFATSVFTVRDGSVEREYRLSLVKGWNLRLSKLVLKDGAGTFSHTVTPEGDKYDGYRASFPTNVKLEDITVDATTAETSVSYTWSVIKDNDNYSVRVKTFDPGRTDELIYTVKLASYSSDATLKLLSVTPGGELSPAFHPDTANYSVTVPGEQEYIFIVALPSHEEAEVNGNKEHDLNSDSTFTVTVTAEDDTKKEYHIKVTRDSGSGIAPLFAQSVQVYGDSRALHVISPAAEKVGIYSVGGKLLYSLDKPAGKASVSGLPKGVLVIKGSSGWVKKAVI
ncbi:MAG: cadherin-like beta sandwich domain-containing protein [Dysgonamonadaceae bacterium]|jgi:hypothetical protein|nr:cadherin-like beta sandwich domain-containing protein [Dysgonamonadaceae bacterium]